MRGLVELDVLKAIEMKLPLNIPVRSFFDLIVGTRFVHEAFFLSPSTYWKHLYHYMDELGFCTACPCRFIVL